MSGWARPARAAAIIPTYVLWVHREPGSAAVSSQLNWLSSKKLETDEELLISNRGIQQQIGRRQFRSLRGRSSLADLVLQHHLHRLVTGYSRRSIDNFGHWRHCHCIHLCRLIGLRSIARSCVFDNKFSGAVDILWKQRLQWHQV